MSQEVRESKYAQLGVDASKQSVRDVFGHYVENDFPHAFVNIIHNPLDTEQVIAHHLDGDGSKFVQRLLNFAETGERKVIRGAVADALEMNLGDIAASGLVFGPLVVADVIDINANNVPKRIIMEEIGFGFRDLLKMYRDHGFDIHFAGGETADLPTQISSVAFNIAVVAFAKKSDVILGNIESGDKIYGFASDGKAVWESEEYNSGIMSNGLTLARRMTMWKGYGEKYPHLGTHFGRYKVGEKAGLPYDMAVSDALVSPTRQWSMLIKSLLEELREEDLYNDLHGISMNTGGGATKVSALGRGIIYCKSMPTPPALFQLIQRESDASWKEMFLAFNCGVGLDIVGKDSPRFQDVLQKVSEQTHVKLFELGRCEASNDGKNHVVLDTQYGTFEY